MITVGAIEMGGGGGNGTLISVDRSGSMSDGAYILAEYLSAVIDAVGGRWACVSHSDYPNLAFLSNGSLTTYGASYAGDFAFEINSGWTTGDSIQSVVGSLDVRQGGDTPECYTRVLWESAQSDTLSSIGGVGSWLLMLLDDYPHWRGGVTPVGYLSDGPDPGRSAGASGSTFAYNGPNLDFLTNGIYAAQAAGWRICVACSAPGGGEQAGFWEQYADEVVIVDGSDPSAISQLINILAS